MDVFEVECDVHHVLSVAAPLYLGPIELESGQKPGY
jgi:hypothetical protein